MSVFVRASLQGTPKTSPGHVALHHMPGLPMNLQSLPPQQRPNAARAQASAARSVAPDPAPESAKSAALDTAAPALLDAAAKAQHCHWFHF